MATPPGTPTEMPETTAANSRCGLPSASEEHRRATRRRRGLAAVIDGDGIGRAVVVQQEAAAADTRGLRLDDAQHHLHGDRRIDGGSAAPKHIQPGSTASGLRRRHHRLRSPPGRPAPADRQQQRNERSRRRSIMRGGHDEQPAEREDRDAVDAHRIGLRGQIGVRLVEFGPLRLLQQSRNGRKPVPAVNCATGSLPVRGC
jgi:hypothetical protein